MSTMSFKKKANLARESENVSVWPTRILTPGRRCKVHINMAKAQRDQRLRSYQVQVNCVKYMVNFIATLPSISESYHHATGIDCHNNSIWTQSGVKLSPSWHQAVNNLLSSCQKHSHHHQQWCQQLASWHLSPTRSHQSSLQSIRLRS